MAQAVVTGDYTRVDDADSDAGWFGIGGGQGPSAEPSFPYQGLNLVNKKITNNGGVRYDPTSDGKSATNMQAAATNTMMVKVIVSDYGGLNAADGVAIQIGSGPNAHYVFLIAGTLAKKLALSKYPPKGGMIIVPINPNVPGYRDSTTGSPNLASTQHFGIDVNFDNSTAKAENVGMDAIDVGTGLTVLGGTAPDAPAKYTDFVDWDEGQVNNRPGFAQSVNGDLLVGYGTWKCGSAAAATRFEDTTSKIQFPDGLFASGFSRIQHSIENAGSTVLDGATLTSLGTTAVVDTRMDYEIVGTAGAATLRHALNNIRQYILTSATTVESAADVECVSLQQNGAAINGAKIRCNSLSGVAVCVDPDFALLDGVRFVKTGAGHAIEIAAPGSYSLNALFEGFGANGANDAAILNSSGGLVTLTPASGNPSYRNMLGSTTNVVTGQSTASFNIEFAGGAPADYEWRLYEKSAIVGTIGEVELDGQETETVTAVNYTYQFTAETECVLQVIADGFIERLFYFDLIDGDQSFNVPVTRDTNI